MPFYRVAVLMTSHNRKELTVASLATLHRQRTAGDMNTEVFVVDDGCIDGTAQAVRERFPCVHLLHGDGALYWNGGMRLAFAVAMNVGFDAYVFMNDDTILYKDALDRLVSLARQRVSEGRPSIVVGSTRSPLTGEQSYGGVNLQVHGVRADLRLMAADPHDPHPCDTMNGNFALIPAQVAKQVGNLDERFQHQFGDLDYGLRARRAGFDVIVTPGYIGDCSDNAVDGTWRDQSSPFLRRWRHLTSPKGVPLGEWLRFTRRHYGWRWPLYACSPYLKTIISASLGSRKQAAPSKLWEEYSCES